MPNFHRFTIKAQEALQNAQDIAAQKNHGELKALHLLAALLEDEQSLVVPVLERSGVNIEKLDEQIDFELDRIPPIISNTPVGQLYLSPELMAVLDKAAKIAAQQKDEFVSCDISFWHCLTWQAPRRAFLKNSASATKRPSDARPASRFNPRDGRNAGNEIPVLEKYAVNISDKAKKGELDPVIGRDEELRRLMQVLSRRYQEQSMSHR